LLVAAEIGIVIPATTPTGNGFLFQFFEFLRGMVCDKIAEISKKWWEAKTMNDFSYG